MAIYPMFDLFLHAAIAGFIVATPVGLTQIIAMERTLNRSLKAGWKVAMGATCAHAIYTTLGVLGISLTSSWLPFDKLSAFILTNKTEIICAVGLLIMVMGLVYLKKEPTKEHKVGPETGFFIGLGIPLMDLGNLATHTAAVSTTGIMNFTAPEGIAVVFALALGAHLSWAWKLSFIYFGKRQLLKRNVKNFNRVFGIFMLCLGGAIFVATSVGLAFKHLL